MVVILKTTKNLSLVAFVTNYAVFCNVRGIKMFYKGCCACLFEGMIKNSKELIVNIIYYGST